MRIGGQRNAAKHVKRNATAAIAKARARRVLGWGAVLMCCFTLFYGVWTQRTYAAEDAEGQAVVQSDGSSTYTVDVALPDSEDKIAVEVNAPEGVLPEGAKLHAELLSNEADTKAVADELDKADVTYDGFTALNVHFTNADGEEIEPNGNVDVKFELPQAALGDDVDASTLAVQHLAEDENGDVTKVDAVADAGDATQGTVEATDDKATANFTVGSFSMFAITWSKSAQSVSVVQSQDNEQAVATSKASNSQVKVYVYVAATGLSNDCLNLLGIDPNTLDKNGYFPAGEIYLDSSYFTNKSNYAVNTPGQPLITSSDDWDDLIDALGQMDTSNLADKTDRSVWKQRYDQIDYTGNRGNHVGEYLSQARKDVGKTWGSQCSALFRWHENPNNADNVHCGFVDQDVDYHLDLFFTTNKIDFVYGNNGITKGGSTNGQDGTRADTRTYITGSEIQEPDEITIPNGWYFDGYYTDPSFKKGTEWDGFGDPLNEDTTVYIKLTRNQVMSLSVQKEIAFAEGTESTTISDQPYTFAISTTDKSVAGQSYTTSTGTGITFSTGPDDAGNYTATVTLTASTQNGVDGTVLVYGLPANNSSGQQISYTVTENTDGTDIDGYSLSGVAYSGGSGKNSNTVTATGQSSTASSTVLATNTYEKSNKGSLTIIKDIYGLNHEQVVKYVEGDLNPKKEGGLRFDVDYFNSETGAVEDDYNNKKVFKGDWTFDTYQTLKHEDAFVTDKDAVTWEGEITEGSEDIANDEEASHYINSSLKYIGVNDGVEHYQYKVTIKDVDLNDWYHVWETHADVVGYDLSASVEAVDSNGKIDAEVLHGGRATAFQLTGDTTVTFTNTYTPLATLKIQKYEDTWNAGNKGAGKDGEFTAPDVNGQNGDTVLKDATFELRKKDGSVVSTVTTGSDGLAIIENLKSGDYWLYETKVPAGYTLLDEPMHIKVDNGVITVAKGSGSLTEPDVSDKTNHVYTVTIENTGISEIPSTGGSGTISAGAVGVAIVVLAGAWLVSKRKGLPKA